jgi:hypothetical protein
MTIWQWFEKSCASAALAWGGTESRRRRKAGNEMGTETKRLAQPTRRDMLKSAAALGGVASITIFDRPHVALGRQAENGHGEELWENRRGAYTTDYNNTLALIRASVEEVARALAGQTGRWDQDVLDKEIVAGEEGAFIFRIRGHVWTEAVAEPWKSGLEQALSSRLATRVISYTVSDTVGAIGYSLYERGELLEEHSATDNGSGRASSDTIFSSRLRSPKQAEIDNIWQFAEGFLVSQDAYEPGIEYRHFFGRKSYRPGERLKVVNPGLARAGRNEQAVSLPPFERVDYVVLRQSGP